DCDYYLLNSAYWMNNHMGLIVYHQTLDNTWDNGTVNDNINKQRMTIAPANNQFHLIDDVVKQQGWNVYRDEIRGHVYPGTSGNTELTDASVPASVVFTGNVLGQPVYDIEIDEENHIHLKYMPRGTLDAPSVFSSTADLHHVTLAWDAPENAEFFRLEYQVDELEAETVDSLENTSYELGALAANTNVRYRVKAMNDEWRNSSFSEWQTISTPTDVATLRTPRSEQTVDVYSLTGIQMGRCMRSQIARYVRGRGGIVIVRYADGSTEKVFVR
ncbi:MAG: fibronectin type III domain-containing protein, partial [Bacteroidaceae bacterium]|nr:fibronectin type III domain-containing protein [Bacteroidaceae bacterium]